MGMEVATALSHSKAVPLSLSVVNNKLSLRPWNKRLCDHALTNNSFQCRSKSNHNGFPLSCTFYLNPCSALPNLKKRCNLLPPPRCSLSSNANLESHNPISKYLTNISFDSMKSTVLQLTPFDIVKWSGILSVIFAASKWTLNTLFNPFFWMYFSWTWLFWPWMVALVVAGYGLYGFWKHRHGDATMFEQLAVVTSVFTWLTLVPPAYFNGYLEGWPFVFFLVYHYFFFFSVTIRKRLYGDYYLRPHDPKWDVNLPMWKRLLFGVGVMIGHWFAAFEGPELHQIPGGWNNIGIWTLIIVTLLMQYNATLYLSKYSEKVVVPTTVVQFGPFRWIRHPIYSSTMLLFATYCVALRAPLSLLFVVAVCLLYYRQKAVQEEALMVEAFGERYTEYASKVKYKFIPFVY